jgi:putative membrane protein
MKRKIAMSRERSLLIAAVALLLIMALSFIHPYDRTTWLMEVAPILIALPVMFATYRRFPLTTLLYVLIFIHALILIGGGHYTYARVPLGYWIEHMFSLHRNPYDKIGHFAQGFVPFLVAREILLRGGYLTSRKMTAFLSVCVVMFVSSFYELIEWWSALAMGQGADEFLGTQGDPWDTQSDMFFALIGASVSLLTMTRLHDCQINQINQMARIKQGEAVGSN